LKKANANHAPLKTIGKDIKKRKRAVFPLIEFPLRSTTFNPNVFIGSVTRLLLQPQEKYAAVKNNTSPCTNIGESLPSSLFPMTTELNIEQINIEKKMGPSNRIDS
jgi:hypothetical protein